VGTVTKGNRYAIEWEMLGTNARASGGSLPFSGVGLSDVTPEVATKTVR
jgi:hypothetical protein